MNTALAAVGRAIDGHRDRHALVRECNPEFSESEVHGAVVELLSLGLVYDHGAIRWKNRAIAKSAPALLGLLDGRFEVRPLRFDECPAYFYLALPRAEAIGSRLPAAVGERFRSGIGCGSNRADALLRCLGEAAELVSVCYRGDETVCAGTFQQMTPEAIHPYRLMTFSERQYRERKTWNAISAEIERIPEPFDEESLVDWIEVESFAVDGPRYVAAANVLLGYPSSSPRFAVVDSNGCAVATTREEAAKRGLLELIERDAIGLWWYGRHQRPAVEVTALRTDWDPALFDWLSARGRRIEALDLTTDVAIPVMAAISRDERDGCPLFGFAAALEPEAALYRAIGELLQLEFAAQMMGLARDGSAAKSGDATPLARWWDALARTPQPQLIPSSTVGRANRAWTRPPCATTFDALMERLARIADECLTADLTRPEVGLPCVRVMAPGLCHYRPRFGAERLYKAPFATGWCEQILTEDDLNPVTLQF